MSNVKTYISKNQDSKVRAIKVTEKNYVGAKDWVGSFKNSKGEPTPVEASFKLNQKTGDVSEHKVRVRAPKGWRVAKPGDYLVRHNDVEGYWFEVIKAEAFAEVYTLV